MKPGEKSELQWEDEHNWLLTTERHFMVMERLKIQAQNSLKLFYLISQKRCDIKPVLSLTM